MWIDRKWAYMNVFALVLNGIFWCLTVFKIVPALLVVITILFILATLVIASYEINRQAARSKKAVTEFRHEGTRNQRANA